MVFVDTLEKNCRETPLLTLCHSNQSFTTISHFDVARVFWTKCSPAKNECRWASPKSTWHLGGKRQLRAALAWLSTSTSSRPSGWACRLHEWWRYASLMKPQVPSSSLAEEPAKCYSIFCKVHWHRSAGCTGRKESFIVWGVKLFSK